MSLGRNRAPCLMAGRASSPPMSHFQRHRLGHGVGNRAKPRSVLRQSALFSEPHDHCGIDANTTTEAEQSATSSTATFHTLHHDACANAPSGSGAQRFRAPGALASLAGAHGSAVPPQLPLSTEERTRTIRGTDPEPVLLRSLQHVFDRAVTTGVPHHPDDKDALFCSWFSHPCIRFLPQRVSPPAKPSP